MRISNKTRCGVRLMINLAQNYGKGPRFLSQIASEEGISEKFLGQIVLVLKPKNLVKSFRGSRGGFVLGKNPGEIRLLSIVEALEGDMSMIEETQDEQRKPTQIAAHQLWSALSHVVSDTLNKYTLEDLKRMCCEENDLFMYNI